jgi:hypothetical protein
MSYDRLITILFNSFFRIFVSFEVVQRIHLKITNHFKHILFIII